MWESALRSVFTFSNTKLHVLLPLLLTAFNSGHFDCCLFILVVLLMIKMFCLLFRKANSLAKLVKKISWYKLGDPDVLFQVQEGSCCLAEMEHKQRKKQWNVISSTWKTTFKQVSLRSRSVKTDPVCTDPKQVTADPSPS